MAGRPYLKPAAWQECLARLSYEQPGLIFLDPPCGPWSSLQNGNDPVTVNQKRWEHLPLWFPTRQVRDEQGMRGGLVAIEQALRSLVLQLQTMAKRQSVERAVVDKLPTWPSRLGVGNRQKWGGLDVDGSHLAIQLDIDSQCNHEPDEHELAHGGTRMGGKSEAR